MLKATDKHTFWKLVVASALTFTSPLYAYWYSLCWSKKNDIRAPAKNTIVAITARITGKIANLKSNLADPSSVESENDCEPISVEA